MNVIQNVGWAMVSVILFAVIVLQMYVIFKTLRSAKTRKRMYDELVQQHKAVKNTNVSCAYTIQSLLYIMSSLYKEIDDPLAVRLRLGYMDSINRNRFADPDGECLGTVADYIFDDIIKGDLDAHDLIRFLDEVGSDYHCAPTEEAEKFKVTLDNYTRMIRLFMLDAEDNRKNRVKEFRKLVGQLEKMGYELPREVLAHEKLIESKDAKDYASQMVTKMSPKEQMEFYLNQMEMLCNEYRDGDITGETVVSTAPVIVTKLGTPE